MNKTITTIIIVVALIAGGILLFTGSSEGSRTTNQTSSTEMSENENSPAVQTDNENQNQPQSEPQGEPKSITVRFTESGFSPQRVEISQGTTVDFVNETDMPMWVASDVHPSHTQYAGSSIREHCQSGAGPESAFDQCKSSQQFSFTFNKPGEWGYHNHPTPSQGGTVVVQ